MNIVKFSNEELKIQFLKSLNYFKECDNRWLYIDIIGIWDGDELEKVIAFLTPIKLVGEEYSEEELNEYGWDETEEIIEINGNADIIVGLDSIETTIEATLVEFIELTNLAIDSEFNDENICICDGNIIIRSDVINTDIYNDLEMYCSKFEYKGISINISLYWESEIYILRTFFDNNFSEDYPLRIQPEVFIDINFDKGKKITNEEISELVNVFIYDVFINKGYKILLMPRENIEYMQYYEETYQEDEEEDYTEINENIFGKGMNQVIKLFNNAEGYNVDRAIVEYVKVIEYVSVTVVRKNIIQETQKKLKEVNAVDSEANYVLEIIELFECMKQKNKSDADMIKSAIKECVDILRISTYAPKFITSLYNLEEKIAANVAKQNTLNSQAVADLARCISDTRNNLSHAKANYNEKGYECPDNQKDEFVMLLRNICIEVITWFSNTDEKIRITKELN